jgi:patatin-like phospholipase/acyl hydrolase
MENFSVCFL